MRRLFLIGCVVLASGCDIAGPVESVDADVKIFRSSCTGAVPEFALSFSIDVTAPKGDGVRFDWDFAAGSSAAVFAPVLDCGWWTPTYIHDTTGDNDSGSDAHGIEAAGCLRGTGPARQIVSVHGRVGVTAARSGQRLDASFTAETFDQDGFAQVGNTFDNSLDCPTPN